MDSCLHIDTKIGGHMLEHAIKSIHIRVDEFATRQKQSTTADLLCRSTIKNVSTLPSPYSGQYLFFSVAGLDK